MSQIKKASRKKGRNRGPRYWVVAMGAAGAIVAFTVGNSHRMFVGYAAEREGVLAISERVDDRFKIIDFNIPAGSLAEVIAGFQKASGITVRLTADEIGGIASPGVVGDFSPEAALKIILSGTGVSYSFTEARSVVLFVEASAATVDVAAGQSPSVSSPKMPTSLKTTPQTVSVIPSDVITQQGATTLRDVLNNVPGITFTAGEGGVPAGDNLTIRGFSGRNDIYVDGVRDLGIQARETFNLEQVEVVKGPSSTYTGRGSTGGTINLVSKLPTLRRSYSGTLTAGTDNTKRATADVNIPFSTDIALRVNAMAHDSNFPGRDDVDQRRWGFAPTLMLGMSSRTRLSLGYMHLSQNNTSDYGIPWVPANNNALAEFRDRPAPVPRSTFYGLVDRDREKLRADMFTARLERDVNDRLTVRNQFRYGYSRRDSVATPPRFADPDSTVINRNMRAWLTNDDIFDNQLDLTSRFETGGISHTLVTGGSFSFEKNLRRFRSGPAMPTTLLDPNPYEEYPFEITWSPLEGEVDARSIAGYALDTIRFNDKWSVVAGIRWDRFAVDGVNVSSNTLVPIDRTDTILSGRGALIFQPVEAGSIYASFGTSANPSLEGLLYQPADVRLDPEKTRTYEIGTKWDLASGRLLLSGAVFEVNKTDARTPSLVAGEPPTLDGDQRVRGFELSATGNITRNWLVFAGYTFLDSEIVASNNPAEMGNSLLNTPRSSFNIWSTYRIGRFFFGGGPRFVGERFGNNVNTRIVDSYLVVDGMMSFKINKNFDIRVNAQNIGDKYYIDRIGGGHILPGPGRVILVSTAFNF